MGSSVAAMDAHVALVGAQNLHTAQFLWGISAKPDRLRAPTRRPRPTLLNENGPPEGGPIPSLAVQAGPKPLPILFLLMHGADRDILAWTMAGQARLAERGQRVGSRVVEVPAIDLHVSHCGLRVVTRRTGRRDL